MASHSSSARWCALLLTTGLLGACGGTVTPPHQAPAHRPPDGRTVFATSCQRCHTVASSSGAGNGDSLHGLHLTRSQLESYARIMPANPPLNSRQIQAVANYLAGLQHGG